MLRAGLVTTCTAGIILGLFVPFVASKRAEADTLEVPECIAVSKSTPYRGYGYAHIVTLRSSCERPLRCEVSTNVTPDRIHIEVEPGRSESVTTRIGSPASTFETLVSCEED